MPEPNASIERRKIMQELYSQGIKIPAIARRFGISPQRVSKILRYEPLSNRKLRKTLAPGEVLDVVSGYRCGEKVPALAARFGVSVSTVYRAISGRSWGEITGISYQPHRAANERIRAQLQALEIDHA